MTNTTMPSGVKITDRVTGRGAHAGPKAEVTAHVRIFLNQGEEVFAAHSEQEHIIHLGKRHTIAGLRKGIEGMCVGGVREIEISPHLAYGEKGVPGIIPPDAMLRCEVRLLKVRELAEV